MVVQKEFEILKIIWDSKCLHYGLHYIELVSLNRELSIEW